MRDYAKIAPQFWIGETGRQLRRLGAGTQVAALYLISSPHANMIGLYYLPIPLFAHETGLSIEGASKALQSLSEVDFAYYDGTSEMVWVPQMARYQLGESLDAKDKRVIGINREYQALTNNPFLKDFYTKYRRSFHLQKARGYEAPSKPLASQEQEQEKEQEQEQERESAHAHAPVYEAAVATGNGVNPYQAPADFEPTAEMLALATKDAPNVDLALATKLFKSLVLRKAVLDWQQRWYQYILEQEQKTRASPGRGRSTVEEKRERAKTGKEQFKELTRGRAQRQRPVLGRDDEIIDGVDYERVDD